MQTVKKRVKLSTLISLNKVQSGVAYGIVWSKDTKNYIYRYWYDNDAGDKQPVVLNVTFDTDNKYLYYSSTLIYPEYL